MKNDEALMLHFLRNHPDRWWTANQVFSVGGYSLFADGPRFRTALKALTDAGMIQRHNLGLKGKVGRGAIYEYGAQTEKGIATAQETC